MALAGALAVASGIAELCFYNCDFRMAVVLTMAPGNGVGGSFGGGFEIGFDRGSDVGSVLEIMILGL